MKQAAEVSNQVTSVDRLVKYSNLPPESQPKGIFYISHLCFRSLLFDESLYHTTY